MSWASTIAGSVSTPNQSSRGGRKVTGWIIHHNAATGGRGVLEMMRTGSKSVSAQYQVLENGDVIGVVPRENRSWSASNAAWDGSSITFEIANNAGAPGWTISERAYHQIAKTIAEDAVWAGIAINRTTVRGHREGSAQGDGGSYSTACPGGIDLDRLVVLANRYRSGDLAAEKVKPIDEGDKAMRYISAEGRGYALIGESGFFPYAPETHGGLTAEYAQVASKLFDGIGVSAREWDIARQDALNRAAAIKAAMGTGMDAGLLSQIIGESLKKIIEASPIQVDAKVDIPKLVKAVNDDLAARVVD